MRERRSVEEAEKLAVVVPMSIWPCSLMVKIPWFVLLATWKRFCQLFASYGYEKEAKEIQDLYLDGKKQEAAAAVPQSFIEATTLIGPEGFVKERLAALKESGVTTLNVMLVGNTTQERVRTLDTLRNLVEML